MQSGENGDGSLQEQMARTRELATSLNNAVKFHTRILQLDFVD